MLDSLPPDWSFDEVARQAGTTVEVGGNTPFLLNEPDTVWCVATGAIELFVVPVDPSGEFGIRTHFFSAAPGDLLFGIDLEKHGHGLGLLAVGVVGTTLLKLPADLIHRMAASTDPNLDPLKSELLARLERWIAGLSHGAARTNFPQPPVDRVLEPHTTTVVPDGQKARTHHGVSWVQCPTGRMLVLGMSEVSWPDRERSLFPLSDEAWLLAIEESQLAVFDSATALRGGAVWPGLDSLYAAVFECEFFNEKLTAVDEYNRLTLKDERALATRSESLVRLASVLGTTGEAAVPITQSDDPLLRACCAVGKAAGIVFVPPAHAKAGHDRVDPLGDITRASRVRMRPVVLSGKWWQRDNGPLLGYLQAGMTPVALVPSSPVSYELHDPLAGTTVPVTEHNAPLLAPMAASFYRPFPDRAIAAWDLFRFGVWGSGRDALTILLMGIGAGLLGLVVPVATGLTFDTIVPEAARDQLAQIALALFVSALASACFTIAQSIALLRIEGRADSSVNAAIMDRLLTLPVAFFRRFTAGDLAGRALGLSEVRRFLSGTILTTLLSSVFSLVSFALLFYYDARLALVATAATVIVVVLTALAGLFLLRYQRQVRDLEGMVSGLVLELITGIAKLRVSGAEDHAFAYWAKEFALQKKLAFKARKITGRLLVMNSVVPLLVFAAVFAWMAFYGQEAALTTGRFLAFIAALGQFLTAVLSITATATVLVTLVPIYERSRPILDSLSEVDDSQDHPGDLRGDIDLSHLSFRYEPDGRFILDDVSTHIRPGEVVAVVGPSGSGKSTLFRLLLGFEKPERGSIHYDGQNLEALDVQAVRRQIGVVLQHSNIMAGDIFRNIVGTSTLTIDDAWEAARKAGLDEDIRLMPMGMHTVVSEGGGTFSGGQKQRLMIARALALNPRILLFDEATSALDNHTQSVVSESLETLRATKIVIAHRLSTIMHADRILVMENGRIVQSGNYQELVAQPGLFQDLAGRQLA